ncbi:AmpG family muropeptide MFS transporter [Sphingoaurantiacus capsulatus]|uniref:AmpG family muropeptide MFS transporter n=1 Tax=Sphingoaurantiacus capsulatus TaxID=1771310 RepID=A0ABV7X8V5_9SPHN
MLAQPRAPSWAEIFIALRQPRMLAVALLGFGSGLPYLLTSLTLGYWLRQEGIALATIGFISWVGMVYSFKVLWAPMVDQVDPPFLHRLLGRRRGWIVLAQIAVSTGLIGMGVAGPTADLAIFAAFAVLTAFASTVQDISISAWRIETAESRSDLALLAAVFQIGHRVAFVVSDALILIAAAFIGWPLSYISLGFAMSVGLAGALLAKEPALRVAAAVAADAAIAGRGLFARITNAFVEPFLTFFRVHGKAATLILAMVGLYRLTDMLMVPMMAPFYVDLGLPTAQIGTIRGTFGMVGTVGGVALGGLLAVRWGLERTLVVGSIVAPLTNFTYVALCLWPGGPSFEVVGVVVLIENLATGFAGAASVAYMSALVGIGFAATQFALLSSVQSMFGKFIRGFSGTAVEWLGTSFALMEAYAIYFVITAFLGVPAILLSIACAKRRLSSVTDV